MTDSQRWFVLSVALLLGLLIYLLESILMPFLAGMLLAYLGDPSADALERKGCSRTLAVVIVFGIFTLIFIGILVVMLPLLGKQIVAFSESIPTTLAWLQLKITPILQSFFPDSTYLVDLEQIKLAVANHWQDASSILTQIIKKMTASSVAMITAAANLMIIPVVTFYLLRDWDNLMLKIRDLLPQNIAPTVVKLAKESDDVLGAFLRGQLTVMIALAVIYAVGLKLVGLNFALLIGLIAGLASVVPYLGPAVGIVVAGVAALIQFSDYWHLLGVLAVFGVGQLLEGMWLTPWLVGDKIGLHPVAVIFAIMAGGQLFGFTGVLLALPIASVLMVILRHLHDNYKSSDLYKNDNVNDDVIEIP